MVVFEIAIRTNFVAKMRNVYHKFIMSGVGSIYLGVPKDGGAFGFVEISQVEPRFCANGIDFFSGDGCFAVTAADVLQVGGKHDVHDSAGAHGAFFHGYFSGGAVYFGLEVGRLVTTNDDLSLVFANFSQEGPFMKQLFVKGQSGQFPAFLFDFLPGALDRIAEMVAFKGRAQEKGDFLRRHIDAVGEQDVAQLVLAEPEVEFIFLLFEELFVLTQVRALGMKP